MINKSIVWHFILFFTFFSRIAFADQHLSAKEQDLNGNIYEIAKLPGIVDINSTITVKIDKDALRKTIHSQYGDLYSSEELNTIQTIQEAVKQGLDNLSFVRLGNCI